MIKCINQMYYWSNVLMIKWIIDQMCKWSNELMIKWINDEMNYWANALMIKCINDQMRIYAPGLPDILAAGRILWHFSHDKAGNSLILSNQSVGCDGTSLNVFRTTGVSYDTHRLLWRGPYSCCCYSCWLLGLQLLLQGVTRVTAVVNGGYKGHSCCWQGLRLLLVKSYSCC